MRYVLLLISLTFLLSASCGTSTSSIDKIQERLNENACRINREELIFQIQELEYRQDTTFKEIPQSFLNDSLLLCPATDQPYLMIVNGNDRMIRCPSGHGESSF